MTISIPHVSSCQIGNHDIHSPAPHHARRRVALVASSYLPHLGGVEEHTRLLAAQLRARGHAVEVWTVQSPKHDLPAREVIDGVPVRRLPAPLAAAEIRSVAEFAARMPGAAARWVTAWRQFRPDVLHVHCFGPNGVWAELLRSVTRTPLVLSLHGETFMDDYDIFGESVLLRTSLRRSLRRARAVTGCSQLTLDDAISRFGLDPAHSAVVFNGVDFDEHADEPAASWPAPERRYFLAMGRHVHNKGFDLAVEAYARIAPSLPDIDLVIAGDGPARTALASRAAELGLADRIHLPGRASRAVVAAAMSQAEAFVMPSRLEPFGIVVLEAWRAGAPVICSNRGGAAEFVTDDDDALLVDPLDVESLAESMRRVATDSPLRQRLSSSGAARVRDFGIAVAVDRYEALYEDVISPL